MTIEDIGKRIELERIRLNLKTLDICLELDIHPNTYRNYESGRRDMPSSLLAHLSTIGFDLMFILTGRTIRELKENDINSVVGGNTPPSFGNPYLTNNFNDVTITYKNDPLLERMYQIEKTFQLAGFTAREEYTVSDLTQAAIFKNKLS
jgi:transcriptional regulator with XRE-family HTH domain